MGKFKSAVQRFGEFLGVAFRQSMKDNVLNSARAGVSDVAGDRSGVDVSVLILQRSRSAGTAFELPFRSATELTGGDTSEQVMRALTTYTRNATTLGIVGLISFLFTMVLLINKVWSGSTRSTAPPNRPIPSNASWGT